MAKQDSPEEIFKKCFYIEVVRDIDKISRIQASRSSIVSMEGQYESREEIDAVVKKMVASLAEAREKGALL